MQTTVTPQMEFDTTLYAITYIVSYMELDPGIYCDPGICTRK